MIFSTLSIPKRNILLLLIIAMTSTSLLFFSSEYSSYISNQILNVSADQVRSESTIEAHHLSQILVQRLLTIEIQTENIASSQEVRAMDVESSRIILERAQDRTGGLVDFYMWLDGQGKIISISDYYSSEFPELKDIDLSQRSYFTVPSTTGEPYYSNVIESSKNISRFFISYPVIVPSDSSIMEFNGALDDKVTEGFRGVVIAGVRLDEIGSFLKASLPTDFQSSFGLIDRNGVILYDENHTLIGKSIRDDNIQFKMRSQLEGSFSEFIGNSQPILSGMYDITDGNSIASIAYQPVLIEGDFFAVLYVLSPHQMPNNVGILIEQQRVISTITLLVFGFVAITIGFIIIVWNRHLQKIVESKTSELKNSNDQLNRAIQRLKVHDKMQNDFINIAAHELRTPTQAILAYSELVQMIPTKKDEVIANIVRNAKRLQRLTSDILDITRFESNSVNLIIERFNLSHFISNILSDYDSQLRKKNLEISLIQRDDIYLNADKNRIMQVFSNLLDNAIKFTNQGKISIIMERSSNDAIVSVKDSGTGIDKTIMEKLFSKFVTKSDSGTGLGLYIAKNIIEAHGGKIWAENNADGSGATFAFSIPISENDNVNNTAIDNN